VDPAALPAVAQLIKARRRRSQTSSKSLVNLRSRATSGGQDEPESSAVATGPRQVKNRQLGGPMAHDRQTLVTQESVARRDVQGVEPLYDLHLAAAGRGF
jgi:hypothetical protein